MARIQFNGDFYLLPDSRVDLLRAEIESMEVGGRITLELQDLSGDVAWLYIPFGAPVTIRYFD